MKYSTIPRVSARPRRTANPYFPHAVRSKHKPHRIAIEGMCAYCEIAAKRLAQEVLL